MDVELPDLPPNVVAVVEIPTIGEDFTITSGRDEQSASLLTSILRGLGAVDTL